MANTPSLLLVYKSITCKHFQSKCFFFLIKWSFQTFDGKYIYATKKSFVINESLYAKPIMDKLNCHCVKIVLFRVILVHILPHSVWIRKKTQVYCDLRHWRKFQFFSMKYPKRIKQTLYNDGIYITAHLI